MLHASDAECMLIPGPGRGNLSHALRQELSVESYEESCGVADAIIAGAWVNAFPGACNCVLGHGIVRSWLYAILGVCHAAASALLSGQHWCFRGCSRRSLWPHQ
jgi:hypothetical protein